MKHFCHVRQEKTHLKEDHLSRLTNGESPDKIDDELLGAYLFSIEMIPRWSQNIVT